MASFDLNHAIFNSSLDLDGIDDKDIEALLKDCFSQEVEDVLNELHIKEDKLDEANFSVVDYINELFPTEQSLSNIEEVIESVQIKISDLDEETRQVIRGQWSAEEKGDKVVMEATEMIQNLFSRIREVQEKATRSEEMVRDITRDIQQLDLAKRNLTLSITTLNNLSLLMSTVDKLRQILNLGYDNVTGVLLAPREQRTSSHIFDNSPGNPFNETSMEHSTNATNTTSGGGGGATIPLPWKEVADAFASAEHVLQTLRTRYHDIPLIRQMDTSVKVIRQELEARGLNEFKQLLTGPGSRNIQALQSTVQQACVVFDLLDERVKLELIQWFLSQQLSEYKVLFEETQNTAWLDKIDHRYSWLRTLLVQFEKKFRNFFPTHWHVMERLILEFCHMTRNDLKRVMSTRRVEIDSRLLVFAIQRTQAFENNLSRSVSTNVIHDLLNPQKKASSTTNDQQQQAMAANNRSTSTRPSSIANDTNDDIGSESSATTNDTNNQIVSPLDGIISTCFEEYISLYVDNVEKQLSDQMSNRLVGDFTVNQSSLQTYASDRDFGGVFLEDGTGATTAGGAGGGIGGSSGGGGDKKTILSTPDAAENTLTSATELFIMYKKVLKQALQLTSGRHSLIPVAHLLRKYLREYVFRVLLPQLPHNTGANLLINTHNLTTMNAISGSGGGGGGTGTGGGNGGGSGSLNTGGGIASSSSSSNLINSSSGSSNMVSSQTKKSAMSGISFAGTTANQILASFLKDEQHIPKFEKGDLEKVCVTLVTASYCLKTIEDLEKKMRNEIMIEFRDEINFTSEIDLYDQLRKSCVQLLVSDLERCCDPALYAMSKMSWSSVNKVGDTSSYVVAIINHCRTNIPIIRDMLFNVKAYFTQVCTKFANALIAKFVASLFKCKSVSTHGAEQLLLDSHSLKTALLEMPVMGSKTLPAPPRSYCNLVLQGMGKAEMIIKVVMTPADKLTFFVENYMRLLPESDATELQKVMDIKGLRRQDQNIVLDIYREKRPSNSMLGGGGAGGGYDGGGRSGGAGGLQGDSGGGSGLVSTTGGGSGSSQTGGVQQTVASVAADQQESSRIKKLERLIKQRF